MTISAAEFQSRQDIFAALNPPQGAATDSKASSIEDMNAEDFLGLMIAQLENQDPTNPMDNMAMMSQLAQFGTVGGIQDLNEAFAGLSRTLTSSQAVQASSMVGRSVATSSNVGQSRYLGMTEAGDAVYGMQATAEMGEGSQGGTYYVQDSVGQLVYTGGIPAGGGTQLIQWNGLDQAGNPLPTGEYRISAESFSGGQQQPVTVNALDQVMSVSVGRTGEVTLNLTSGQSMRVDEVKEFF